MPAIQRDFCRTAASKLAGKCSRVVTSAREAHEGAVQAETADAQAELIIFGEARLVERRTEARCQHVEHVPPDRAADARGRQARADRLAHDHLLAVRFQEFVDIAPGDPPGRLVDQRDDRKLDEREAVDQRIEQSELAGMDDIFRIVEHDSLEKALGGLVAAHRRPQPIEAIGLVGRTVDRADDHPNISTFVVTNDVNRRPVIWIASHVNHMVVTGEGFRRAVEHLSNDIGFAPCRNEDREASRRDRIRQARDATALVSRHHHKPSRATSYPYEIDEKIADAKNKQAASRKQGQLA